jgi:hypothetical protein
MSVWITVPSARPVAEVQKWAAAWRERGYKIALWRDTYEQDIGDVCECHCVGIEPYPGYAKVINELIAMVILRDPSAEWFIAAGDDVFPDPNHTAEEIAAQCRAYFGERQRRVLVADYTSGDAAEAGAGIWYSTFGVMQPTGDRWCDRQGPMSERVAGSAWIGRDFAKRVNGGNGPLWPEYYHYCVDEELQEVATRLGVFWQRPDIIHHHQHYMRSGDSVARATVPAHLERANSEFMAARRKFATRKANRFPGSECL